MAWQEGQEGKQALAGRAENLFLLLDSEERTREVGRGHWVRWVELMEDHMGVDGLDFLVEHQILQSAQSKAATAIQAIFQGRKGRAKGALQRENMAVEALARRGRVERRAATRIQSNFRGERGRSEAER